MSKEEFEKEAENKGVEYADSLEYTILKFSDEEGCWSQVEQAYEKGALDFAEAREKRITDFKKENEELKAQVEKQNSDILALKILTERLRLKIDTLEGQTPWKDIKDKSEVIGRLTKAKEIIEKLINAFASNDFFEEEELNAMSEAEQFLKEAEE